MADCEQYYKKSMEALTNIIKDKKETPTEKEWNKIAGEQGYLTSQSLGYIAQMKFPELCKKTYKEIQAQRKKKNID